MKMKWSGADKIEFPKSVQKNNEKIIRSPRMHKALLLNGFSVVQSDQYAIARDSCWGGNQYTLLWHKENEWLNVKEVSRGPVPDP